jgi:hypothetical protein
MELLPPFGESRFLLTIKCRSFDLAKKYSHGSIGEIRKKPWPKGRMN